MHRLRPDAHRLYYVSAALHAFALQTVRVELDGVSMMAQDTQTQRRPPRCKAAKTLLYMIRIAKEPDRDVCMVQVLFLSQPYIPSNTI